MQTKTAIIILLCLFVVSSIFTVFLYFQNCYFNQSSVESNTVISDSEFENQKNIASREEVLKKLKDASTKARGLDSSVFINEIERKNILKDLNKIAAQNAGIGSSTFFSESERLEILKKVKETTNKTEDYPFIYK